MTFHYLKQVVKVILTYGRIAAADGRLNRIRHVVTMCRPISAHRSNIANTIELVLPYAQPSPQPKRQIDRVSHFAQLTAMRHLSPRNLPFPWGIWTPSNTRFFGLTHVLNPNGISTNVCHGKVS